MNHQNDMKHQRLCDLPTPALILDESILQRNLSNMQDRANSLGVELRPHMKTAKSADIARRAILSENPKITVATLNEARYFFEHGVPDISYAVGITDAKLNEVSALMCSGLKLHIITDSLQMCERIIKTGQETASIFSVLLELDCGAQRAGFDINDSRIFDAARRLNDSKYASFAGVMTHAGHSYAVKNVSEITAIAELERHAVVSVAEQLESQGIECKTRSVGSTPTAVHAEHLKGVTEMRPGVYMLNDWFQVCLGTCSSQDMAVSVLATVVSERSENGYRLIDAGALALSQDTSAATVFAGEVSYGQVYDELGKHRFSDLKLDTAHQEHGWLRAPDGGFNSNHPDLGDRIRVFPNHACMMAAPYDRYYVTDGSDQIVDVWDKTRGWQYE